MVVIKIENGTAVAQWRKFCQGLVKHIDNIAILNNVLVMIGLPLTLLVLVLVLLKAQSKL